ncbi:MAG: hypothetical protein OSB09_00910 [Planctomycetota bacterium]|nr:hypothetical protein [Planctomycetota bacterium]
MRWNIEKGFCVICLGFLLLSVLGLAKTYILEDPLAGVDLRVPESSDGGTVGGLVRLEWYEPAPIEMARNPFSSVSEWKTAPTDLLGVPPLSPVLRRVPLPALVSGDPRTRLRAELATPVAVEDEKESQ